MTDQRREILQAVAYSDSATVDQRLKAFELLDRMHERNEDRRDFLLTLDALSDEELARELKALAVPCSTESDEDFLAEGDRRVRVEVLAKEMARELTAALQATNAQLREQIRNLVEAREKVVQLPDHPTRSKPVTTLPSAPETANNADVAQAALISEREKRWPEHDDGDTVFSKRRRR